MLTRAATDRRKTPRPESFERRLMALEMIREQLGTTPPPPRELTGLGAAVLGFLVAVGPSFVIVSALVGH
jgi:hypothetical protein